MNKSLAGFATAGLLTIALSACSLPGASAAPDVHQSQSQPQSQSPASHDQSAPSAQQKPAQVSVGDSSSSSDATVALNGERFTCGEITDDADGCDKYTQRAFELYGGSLDGYVNSGRLGVLNLQTYSFQDAAYAGLVACTFQVDESTRYVKFMQGDSTFSDLGSELLPAFFEAHRNVCS